MAIDGPQDIANAERGIPLVQPASQQNANIAKQWQAEISTASLNQPSVQHNLNKMEQKVDVEAPIERKPESFPANVSHNDGLQKREPGRLNQLEAQVVLRQFILERARQQRAGLFRRPKKGQRRTPPPSQDAGQDQPSQEDDAESAV